MYHEYGKYQTGTAFAIGLNRIYAECHNAVIRFKRLTGIVYIGCHTPRIAARMVTFVRTEARGAIPILRGACVRKADR